MNELAFNRVDLIQTGQQKKKCTKVLPLEKRAKLQKIVVGDDSGILQCFWMKKGDVCNVFKTSASKNNIMGIELSGTTSMNKHIFFISKFSVSGVSRKGKEFFRFETNLAEPLRSLCVDDVNLYLAGDYIYSHFVESVDRDFFMCNDRINDMILCHITSDHEWDPVFACQDRNIRVIQGSDVFHEIPVDGPVMTLVELKIPESSRGRGSFSTDRTIIYGTGNGILGEILVNNIDFKKLWQLPDTMGDGGILSLDTCDLLNEDQVQVIVGRESGTLECYTFRNGYDRAPNRIFRTVINESIQSLDHGQILAPKYEEIVVSTFSGKVMSFTPDPSNVSQSVEISEEMKEKLYYAKDNSELTRKCRGVENDIRKLQEKIKKEQDKRKSIESHEVNGLLSTPISTCHLPTFDVNSNLVLSPQNSCYLLSLETKIPLDCIIFRSDFPLDIEEGGKTISLIARTPPNPKEGNYLLATCRISQASNHRVDVKLRPVEGQHGTLTAYVVPSFSSPRSACALNFSVCSLSMHERVNEISDLQDRPLNVLKVKGSFTVAEIHSWLSCVLPELPERVTESRVTFFYRSAFTGTVLVAQYSQGEGIFRSDSVFSISVLKEGISREAIARKTRINIGLSVKSETIDSVLDLIHPLVEYQFILSRNVMLIDALKELSQQEDNCDSYMPEEYLDLLENATEIKGEYEENPHKLDFLFEEIVKLFRVKCKVKGKSSEPLEDELRQLLKNYDLDEIRRFFARPLQ